MRRRLGRPSPYQLPDTLLRHHFDAAAASSAASSAFAPHRWRSASRRPGDPSGGPVAGVAGGPILRCTFFRPSPMHELLGSDAGYVSGAGSHRRLACFDRLSDLSPGAGYCSPGPADKWPAHPSGPTDIPLRSSTACALPACREEIQCRSFPAVMARLPAIPCSSAPSAHHGLLHMVSTVQAISPAATESMRLAVRAFSPRPADLHGYCVLKGSLPRCSSPSGLSFQRSPRRASVSAGGKVGLLPVNLGANPTDAITQMQYTGCNFFTPICAPAIHRRTAGHQPAARR